MRFHPATPVFAVDDTTATAIAASETLRRASTARPQPRRIRDPRIAIWHGRPTTPGL